MKRPETSTLSSADLSEARGGYPADPAARVPEDPTGRPVFPGQRAPAAGVPHVPGKPMPGQTPPIYVVPTA